jgi:hypothetical protein
LFSANARITVVGPQNGVAAWSIEFGLSILASNPVPRSTR